MFVSLIKPLILLCFLFALAHAETTLSPDNGPQELTEADQQAIQQAKKAIEAATQGELDFEEST